MSSVLTKESLHAWPTPWPSEWNFGLIALVVLAAVAIAAALIMPEIIAP
jgi:hypothetical protein